MKKSLLIILFLIIALTFSALAQEEGQAQQQPTGQSNVPSGYNITKSEHYITIYNPLEIKSIFGYEPVARNGLLKIIFSTGRQVELGYIYGEVVADVPNKILRVANGGFIGIGRELPRAGEEMSSRMLIMNMSGSLVEINARYTPLQFRTTNGIYTHNNYSFICNGECTFLADIAKGFYAALKITGNASIVKSDMLSAFKNGEEVDGKWHADISGFHQIAVMPGEELSLELYKSQNARNVQGKFDETEIISEGFVQITRRQEDAGYYDAISSSQLANERPVDNRMQITAPSESSLALVSLTPNSLTSVTLKRRGAANRLSITDTNSVDIVFVLGIVRILPKQSQFDNCQPAGSSCIFVDPLAKVVSVKPDVTQTGTVMKLIFPQLSTFSEIEQLNIDRIGNRFTLMAGRKGDFSQLTFTNKDVTINEGNWFDLRISFSSYVYENVGIYNHFECDSTLRECYLDGQKVSGFREQTTTACRRDSECNEGMSCRCLQETRRGVCSPALNRCVKNLECFKASELNPSASTDAGFDILLVPDGYTNREDFIKDAKKVVETIFSVQPFGRQRSNFNFYSVPIGADIPIGVSTDMSMGGLGVAFPLSNVINTMTKNCGNSDLKIILSKKRFISFADRNNIVVISMSSITEVLTIVHELGHGLELSDEYVIPGTRNTVLRDALNCVTNENAARRFWFGILKNEDEVERLIIEAKSWTGEDRGCGGVCNEQQCRNYLRPSFSSIMRHEGRVNEENSDKFNTISELWLEDKIKAFS